MFVLRSVIGGNVTSGYDSQIRHEFPYVRLCKGKTVWMSNTPMEMGTGMEFMRNAHGKVFVAGLGIGVTLLPVLEKEEVEKIVVCEIDKKVIDIWEKSSQRIDTSKIEVHHCDVHEPEKFIQKGEKFDTLWFDIWPTICSDNYPETKELYAKYRKHINYKNKNRYVGFWMRDYIKKEYQKDSENFSHILGY